MYKYMECMKKMGNSELRKYLGQDIIDLLVQWFPDGDNLLTKNKMISLINSIYGKNIFKDKSFRRSLLECLDESEIIKIKNKFFKNTNYTDKNVSEIIDIIVDKPWEESNLNNYLINLLEVPFLPFDKKHDDEIVENLISASTEQFYELLDYQYYIKQRILNNLNSGYQLERMLVHMPTGTGKTKTTMHVITNYINFSLKNEGVVIWVAHTNELLRQAYDTFLNVWQHLGNGPITAYKLWGKSNIENIEPQIKGIIFCGLSKLMSIAKNNNDLYEKLKKDCRLLIFDEAHKAGATETKKIINDIIKMPKGYKNRALIGLTATPGRTTDSSIENKLLTDMFGNKLINIDADIINKINYGPLRALNIVAEENIIKYFQERKILSKMSAERLSYKKIFSESELKVLSSALKDIGYDEKEYTAEQLKVFADNKERNLAIIKRIKELSIEQVPTIVFACSVSHAKILSAMLTIDNIPNSLVIGEMDKLERRCAIEAFKDNTTNVNVIINYEVLTTGFDSKNIRCVFITRPTKSIVLYSQMLGRGLRGPLMGGNEECLLIDIDDNLKAFNNETAFSHFDKYWKR